MNWEVNLGNLLVVASILFSAGGFYAVSRWDSKQIKIDLNRTNREIKEDITDIKVDLKTLNKVVMDVAVQNQRLDNQAERISLLEKRNDERLTGLERRYDESAEP
jgi:hypothetical protein